MSSTARITSESSIPSTPRAWWRRSLIIEAAQNAGLLTDEERELVGDLSQQWEIADGQLTALNGVIIRLRSMPGYRPLEIFRPVKLRDPKSIPPRETGA